MEKNKKDILIGQKLRQIRNLKGISQSVLANDSGVTFQQIQKYEKGSNRISSSRLHDFAEILGVDITYFFDGLSNVNSQDKKFAFGENDDSSFDKKDIMTSKETLTLVREYYKISDNNKRKSVLDLIKAMNENN